MDKATSPWDCSPTCFISAWGQAGMETRFRTVSKAKKKASVQTPKPVCEYVTPLLHGVTHSSDM